MERMRILAAAAALKEFTASELAVFSGANENTVRSVLHREKELFEPVAGEARKAGKGRPANLYRVLNIDRIRREVRELERVLDVADSAVTELPSEGESEQERLAAIVVAEDAALRAWRSESTDEKRVLAATARRSLDQANLDDVDGETALRLERRADCVGTFTALAETDARGETIKPEMFIQAWSALADYAEDLPDRAQEIRTGLADVAIRHDQLPPLAVLTDASVTPAEAMPELGLDWTRLDIDQDDEALWTPSWARRLVERQLIAAFVVHDRGLTGPKLEHSLGHVADWHLPAMLITDDVTQDVVVQASRAGAYCLPASGGRRVVAETLQSALAGFERYKLFE